MTSSAEQDPEWSHEYEELPTEELVRRQGVRPMTVEDFYALNLPDPWESDEEYAEFLDDLSASRRGVAA